MTKNNLLILFILSPVLAYPSVSRADAEADYYHQIRSLKKLNQTEAKKVRAKTIDAEQIKKANEASRANTEANKEIAERIKKQSKNPKSVATTSNPEKKVDIAPVTKSSKPKTAPEKSEEVTHTEPTKVSHETPDELSFPGDEPAPKATPHQKK